MEALSFPQTRWSFSPKICAANWAAASGERMVEQPRPARGKEAQSQLCMLNLTKAYIGGRGGALSSPLGIRREDQTSWAPQSGVRGGQLMTGYAVFPDMTGPRPLLLPATATKTVGTPSPEVNKKMKMTIGLMIQRWGQDTDPLSQRNPHLHTLP